MTWLKIVIQTLTHLIGKKADKRDVEQLRRDTIPAPATASPGQTIVVKTVDDNGKPIEWEAGEAGSGSRSWIITESYPVSYSDPPVFAANFTPGELAASLDGGMVPRIVLHGIAYNTDDEEGFIADRYVPVCEISYYKRTDGSFSFDIIFQPVGDNERLMVYTSDGNLFWD